MGTRIIEEYTCDLCEKRLEKGVLQIITVTSSLTGKINAKMELCPECVNEIQISLIENKKARAPYLGGY